MLLFYSNTIKNCRERDTFTQPTSKTLRTDATRPLDLGPSLSNPPDFTVTDFHLKKYVDAYPVLCSTSDIFF